MEVSDINKWLNNFDEVEFKKAGVAVGVGDVRICYWILRLKKIPHIRLPCHNVSLQCAFEMARADFGSYVDHPAHLAKWIKGKGRANQVTVNRETIRRNRPEPYLFAAMVLWATGEGLHLSVEEKMKLLVKVCRIDKISCKYSETSKSELFAKQINDYFKAHLGLK